MNIGFDAKRLFLNHTGLGNYSRDLVRSLLHYHPTNSYFLYTPEGEIDLRTKFLKGDTNATIIKPTGVNKSLKSYWRSIKLEKELIKNKIDVFHGLSHEIPKKGKNSKIKYVLTVHDLIFLRYPENYSAIDRKIYTKKIRYAVKHADRIIAISEQTKRDLIEFLKVDPGKIQVIYQTCADAYKNDLSVLYVESIRKKYNLPENFILSVGTIEKRKNIASLVEAIGKSNTKLPLIIIGGKTPYVKEVQAMIEKYKLEDQVGFYENISFLDLPALYAMANVFAYPSVFEGFGIPILEALYSKTPVIAANGSCLEEVGGPSTIYVPPFNTDELASKLDLVIESLELQEKMKTDGYNHALKFSSEKQAQEVMDLYKEVMKN